MIMKKITKLLSLGLCCCAAACSNPSQKASDPDFTDSVSEALAADGKIDFANLEWTREPASYTVEENRITITTAPHTDLWQRTYYHFRNDNAPVFQMQTKEQYFSFTVKTDFTQSHHRFDQCGIVMYLDSDNWLKGSVEYENEDFQHLGSVVTNNGYSDWATTAIPADVKTMWYRFSRRADDYCIECSSDGENFSQMRICHMYKGADQISFGIYACSPEDSSFTAVFTDMKITECMWKAHDGQQPDAE
jgi:regulation of enolase protein 1 (concanavalin A-like superfamily)